MSDNLNNPASTPASTPAPKTKEQKLAELDARIAKLVAQREDVVNGVTTTRPAKVAYCPAVLDVVLATIGRNTATSKQQIVQGTVVAVRHPVANAEGKLVGGIQCRVRVYEGTFEEQLVTLYPAQLQAVPKDSVVVNPEASDAADLADFLADKPAADF